MVTPRQWEGGCACSAVTALCNFHCSKTLNNTSQCWVIETSLLISERSHRNFHLLLKRTKCSWFMAYSSQATSCCENCPRSQALGHSTPWRKDEHVGNVEIIAQGIEQPPYASMLFFNVTFKTQVHRTLPFLRHLQLGHRSQCLYKNCCRRGPVWSWICDGKS